MMRLTTSQDEWKRDIDEAFPKERAPPIPGRVDWSGGAKMSFLEFLSLRAVWPDLPQNTVLERVFETELKRELDTARDWLNSFPPFKAYLESIENSRAATLWRPEDPESHERALSLGIMQLARSQQIQLMDAIRDGAHDEEMVISSLVNFLDGITLLCPHVRCGWSSKRQLIDGDFGVHKLRVYVDGLLVAQDRSPKVFLEAKKGLRQNCEPKVCWQETAEFVAFLKSATTPPSHERHFFMLAQNKDQCFVIAFAFDEAYVEYIREGTVPGPTEGFLTVKKYGPYQLDNHEEMERFARIALAISIRSCPPPDLSQSGSIVSPQA